MKNNRDKEQTKDNLRYRRLTFRLYPNEKQEALLFDYLNKSRHLYNAILELRRDVYRKAGKHLSNIEICAQITELRHVDHDYQEMNAQSLQCVSERNSFAFDNFFKRVKSGEAKPSSNRSKIGYPRFKSRDRYHSFSYKTHGDGWKHHSVNGVSSDSKNKKKMRNGYLELTGIGKIKIRGAGKVEGLPVTCDIIYKAGTWYESLVIDTKPSEKKFDEIKKYKIKNKKVTTLSIEAKLNPKPPHREAGAQAAGFDWGIESFATLALEDGTYEAIPNPRNGKKSKDALAQAQQELSRKKKGSKNRKKAKRKVQQVYLKIKNQRNDFLHQVSNDLIKRFGILATEKLDIQFLVEKNAKEGHSGLIREILDLAPSRFLSFCSYKAEEAGSVYGEIDTKKWKPSQTCSGCGALVPKALSVRVHECPNCGLELGRDENSSRVCLNVQLFGKSNKLDLIPSGTKNVRSQELTHYGGPFGPMSSRVSGFAK